MVFTPEEEQLIARVQLEEQIRQQVRESMLNPKRNGLPGFFDAVKVFLCDKETLRTIVTVVAIPAAIWYFNRGQQDLANTRADVDEVTKLIPFLAQPGPEAAIAYTMLTSLQEKRKSSRLFPIVLQAAKASPNSAVATQGAIATATESPPKINPQILMTPPPGVPAIAASTLPIKPQLVYIQYYGEGDQAIAGNFQSALLAEGIPVPETQDVCKTNSQNTIKYAQKSSIGIRYYYSGDMAAAAYTASVLKTVVAALPPSNRFKSTPIVLQDLTNWQFSAKPNIGTLEVWLPLNETTGC